MLLAINRKEINCETMFITFTFPGCSIRWFRLKGNLLFYLKGPEPWYESVGFIVLGQHKIHIQTQDENGYWPFHLGKPFLSILV